MTAGDLVPDHLIIKMVEEKLTALPAGSGVIFDGFPRTEAQASAFQMMLQPLGRTIDGVVVLEASDEVLTERNLWSPFLPIVWVCLQYGPRAA